jgi:subfamily B ATP-binding cassette protein MsbA
MTVDAANNRKEAAAPISPFAMFIHFLKPYKYTITLIVAIAMLKFVTPLTMPWMTRILIDDVFQHKTGFWTLEKTTAVMCAVFVAGVLLDLGQSFATSRLGNGMAADLRRRLFRHIQKLPQRYFDSHNVGAVVSRVLHDVNGAQNVVTGGAVNLIINLVMVVFAAIMLFRLDSRLALMSVWLLPLYYLTFTNMNVRIRYAWRAVHRQIESMSGLLVERIAGIKIVQSFNREQTDYEQFARQTDSHRSYTVSAQLKSGILDSFTQSFNNVGTVIVWFAGGRAVLAGHMSIGTLIAFQSYLGLMYGPIRSFSQVNIMIQNAMTNIQRIFEILAIEPDIRNGDDPVAFPVCRGQVTFRHVSFSYVTELERKPAQQPGQREQAGPPKPDKAFYLLPPRTAAPPAPTYTETRTALTGIHFHAQPGQIVALVGPSGGGKSSLIQLIPRFYDPAEGSVLIDGIDIREYDLNDLRSHIALVMQDNLLFSGSIYDNIAYGREHATRREIEEAAKAAHAHDFIEKLENGYDTMLGERGVRLSGGQKQRIAIARALVKNPRILILDEATSALDAESEALVNEALEVLMKGRTTFIIAHRLATVVRADCIFVLEDGRITERGTHAELLRSGGTYRELYEKQLKAMRAEPV